MPHPIPSVTSSPPLHVALFATCLVETLHPAVGFATLKLFGDSGLTVTVPPGQTCCGQPAFNSGDRDGAKRLARRVIAEFELFDAVVVPSGSCAGMICVHYPNLFANNPAWADRARALAEKTFELTAFLTDALKISPHHHPPERQRHLSRQLFLPPRTGRGGTTAPPA